MIAMNIVILVSCIIIGEYMAEATDDLIVELIQPRGKIRGHTLVSAKSNEYYAFQEIPYAAPPVGENRFKPPKSHQGWEGILDTTKNTKKCYQFQTFIPSELKNGGSDDIAMSEDCLFLNVYTPVKPGSEKALPVYFFIHGGANAVGDGTYASLGPKYLIDGEIVIVTMNYRLGPFGYLSIHHKDNSGNMALKDQHMALQWTHRNIHLFGGNPKDIVLGGQSSGAFSAGFHLLSPKTEGLITAVIQQSGSPLSAAAYMASAKRFALTLGRALDPSITAHNNSHLIETLKKASPKDIQTASLKVSSPYPLGFMQSPSTWGPVVENHNSDEAFITTPMHQAFMRGHFHQVPALIGFNSQEAIFFLPHDDSVLEEAAARFDSDPSMLVEETLRVENRTLVGIELRAAYTSKTFKNDFSALVEFTSDVVFMHPSIRQAELSSKHVPVYLYQLSAGKNVNDRFPGIAHGADLKYFWKMQSSFDHSPVDESIREVLLRLWWNFIKYKNPTPRRDVVLKNIEWPPVEPENIRYLNISEDMNIGTNPSNYSVIKGVLEKYIRPPYYIF
ncbi:unnamed protein product [Phaedon cochleariae]|uniref:Carboxylic ester hydrolase n=1 Tax=Phaedon cochleariae TaxID=80249 RepID=A0A9P0DSW7_PHACE|nr:unnamed protein product [Phaedon cochleariae]